MNTFLGALTLGAQVTSVHRGAVLPEGRIVVVLVPLAALAFYFFVVRRNRDR
jgi:hypothetical protein